MYRLKFVLFFLYFEKNFSRETSFKAGKLKERIGKLEMDLDRRWTGFSEEFEVHDASTLVIVSYHLSYSRDSYIALLKLHDGVTNFHVSEISCDFFLFSV